MEHIKVKIDEIEFELNPSEVQEFLKDASRLGHEVHGWFECDSCSTWFPEDCIGSCEEGILCVDCNKVLEECLANPEPDGKVYKFEDGVKVEFTLDGEIKNNKEVVVMERLEQIVALNQELRERIEALVTKVKEAQELRVIYVGVTAFAKEGEPYADGVYLAGSQFHPFLASPLESDSGDIDLFWNWVNSQLDNNLTIVDLDYTIEEIRETWIISDEACEVEEMLECLTFEFGTFLGEIKEPIGKEVTIPYEAIDVLRELIDERIEVNQSMLSKPEQELDDDPETIESIKQETKVLQELRHNI